MSGMPQSGYSHHYIPGAQHQCWLRMHAIRRLARFEMNQWLTSSSARTMIGKARM
jgi:hypothetical protein